MTRLDKYLFENKFFPSRAKAVDAILHNTISVNDIIINKPSKEIIYSDNIKIINIFNKYVSRGGLKLEKAIEVFNLNFSNKTVLDIGASSGGFTDCALQHGADFCFCVDVGNNQLNDSIKNNNKVKYLENKDFRELSFEDVNYDKFDFIVADISFISLTAIVSGVKNFLKDDGNIIFLIKPQFEAGKSFLNKHGIVTDEKGYKLSINKVVSAAKQEGLFLNNISVSTLYEYQKNVEFLALFSENNTLFNISFSLLSNEIKKMKKNEKK